MKCIILRSGKVIRTKNDRAAKLVTADQADYCPKSIWKKQRKES